jgi:hypothetical protein
MQLAYYAIYFCVFVLQASMTRFIPYQQLHIDQQLKTIAHRGAGYLFSSDDWLHFSELYTHIIERTVNCNKCTRIILMSKMF